MSLVIARDGKVFVVANAEYLTPIEAYNLSDELKAASLRTYAQQRLKSAKKQLADYKEQTHDL